MNSYKRAIVFSGGGSKGSFGAGVLNALDKEYELYLGTSTGALLAALAACGKVKELKDLYTIHINTDSIYTKNPYNKKGNLRIVRLIRRILFSKEKSIGDTLPLLDLIRRNFTKQDYNSILQKNRNVIITVTNMDYPKCEYKSIKDYSYEDFTYFLWISTLGYPITNYVKFNGVNYADGGHSVPIPLSLACKMADEVDAIFLTPKNNIVNFEPKNIVDGFIDLIGVKMRFDTVQELERVQKVVDAKERLKIPFKLNCYYTPYSLTSKEFFFDKDSMLKWYNIGYKSVTKSI